MYSREKATRLHLVRHAEVDEAYHEVFGGQIDMELSPVGHEQAKGLAKFLNGRTFDRIYRSPMVRVRQTAKPLLDALGREAQVIEDLREVDFGVWTGHKWHEIQEKFGMDAEDWLIAHPSPVRPTFLICPSVLMPAVRTTLSPQNGLNPSAFMSGFWISPWLRGLL